MKIHAIFFLIFLLTVGVFAQTPEEIAAKKANKIIEEFGSRDELDAEQFKKYIIHQVFIRFDKDYSRDGDDNQYQIDFYEYLNSYLYIRPGDITTLQSKPEIMRRFVEDSDRKDLISPDTSFFNESSNIWVPKIVEALRKKICVRCNSTDPVTTTHLTNWILQNLKAATHDQIQFLLSKVNPLESHIEVEEFWVKNALAEYWFVDSDKDQSGFLDFWEFFSKLSSIQPEKGFQDFLNMQSDFIIKKEDFLKEYDNGEIIGKMLDDAWREFNKNVITKVRETVADFKKDLDKYRKKLAEEKENKLFPKKSRGYVPGIGFVLSPTVGRKVNDVGVVTGYDLVHRINPQIVKASWVMRVIKDYEKWGKSNAEAAELTITDPAGADRLSEWKGAFRLSRIHPKWDEGLRFSTGIDSTRTSIKARKKDLKYYFTMDALLNHGGSVLSGSRFMIGPYFQETTTWEDKALLDAGGNPLMGVDGETLTEVIRKETESLNGLIEWKPIWGPNGKWGSDQLLYCSEDSDNGFQWNTRFSYVINDIRKQPDPEDGKDPLRDKNFLRSKFEMSIKFANGWSRLDYNFTHWNALEGGLRDSRFHEITLSLILIGNFKHQPEDERASLKLSYVQGVENPVAEEKEVERTKLAFAVKF